ncbi:MAG: DNA polymerase III subunit beta [Coriobacteriales bacterium]|jgi:DNA polymerase-3 subunit beta|nr:DNA polymerase III subunit beta [Coriobacteriales bacterium]
MKLTIEKNRLSHSLGVVAKGMSSRTTLPILSSVHLEAQQSSLVFHTTDLEVSISHSAEALIEQEGATVVPGRLFADIVKSLPDAAVTLEQTNEGLRVLCMDCEFLLKTLNPSDFPLFPQADTQKLISLPAAQFSSMIKKVTKAVSKDESRAVLTGVFLNVEGAELQMVATDSYRLAIVESKLDLAPEEAISLIVPGDILDEIARLVTSEETVSVGEGENQIIFTFSNTLFITRKIEGNYPNYKAIIPVEKNCTAVASTAVLLSAVKRIALTAQVHTPLRFSFSSEDQTIEISSQTQDVARAKEKIPAQIEGAPLDIGFNHQYILDGLNAIDTKEVLFEAQTSLKPGILKTVGEDYFFYLTMPVRIEAN